MTVMPYLWNGHARVMLEDESEMEKRAAQELRNCLWMRNFGRSACGTFGAAGLREASARILGEISLLRQVRGHSDIEEPQRIRAEGPGRLPSAELSRKEVGVRFRGSASRRRCREPFRGNQWEGCAGTVLSGAVEGRKEQRQREDRQWTALLDRAKKEAGALSARWIDEISEIQSSGFMPYLKRRDREAAEIWMRRSVC